MKSGFSITEITKILDVKFETFRTWLKLRYISPTFPAPSQGKPATFTREDLYLIALFKNLIESGIKREIAAAHLRGFRNSKETVKNSKYIIFEFPGVEGSTGPMMRHIYYAENKGSDDLETNMILKFIKDDLPKLEHSHFINFGKIKERIDSKIELLF